MATLKLPLLRLTRRWTGVVMVLGLLSMSALTAQTTHHTEATDGDLPNVAFTPRPSFTVVDGNNIWTGTTSSGDQDVWSIVIPSGATLNSVTWSGPVGNDNSIIGNFELVGSGVSFNPQYDGNTFTPSGGIAGPKTLTGRVTFDLVSGTPTWTVTANVTVPPATAPSITLNPSNTTAIEGANTTFSAAASGSPTPTVQWEVSTDNGANFSNVPGATGTSYVFAPTLGEDGNQYRAVFTNSAGSATTNAATLTVVSPPTLNVSLSPQIFTSSGGTMRTVFASATAGGGISPVVTLQGITSSDPDAGTFTGDQPDDIQNEDIGTNDTQFDLRAEITPPNDDRTYEVTYRVTDGTYTADVTKPVIVPSGIGTLAPGGTNDCGIFLGTLPEMTGPTVNIPYSLNNPTTVRLTIYNTKGKAVYGLVNEVAQSPDAYSVPWDGTNNAGLYPGTQQPNGYYFVLIEGCADYREVGILVVNR